MTQPFSELLDGLEQKLIDINQSNKSRIDTCAYSIQACQYFLAKLRKHYDAITFETLEDEISFFKKIKPKIHSELLYQIEVFEYYRTLPKGSDDAKKSHINSQLDKAAKYLSNHCDLHSYMTLGYKHLDLIYFVRQDFEPLVHGRLEPPSDQNFSSPADVTVSKLLARDKFIGFLRSELHNIENTNFVPTWNSEEKLKWDKSKTDLVELIYSLHSSGAVPGELKEVFQTVEKLFDIKLGNYYRTYTDIKLKKNPTKFIDDLKISLLEKIKKENQ